MSIIARMFGQKPAAKPALTGALEPEWVSLATHRSVVAAYQEHVETLQASCFEAERRFEAEKNRAITSGRVASEALTERDAAHETLRAIVAMKTDNCASIGRRMAAAAKAGLPEYAAAEREAA